MSVIGTLVDGKPTCAICGRPIIAYYDGAKARVCSFCGREYSRLLDGSLPVGLGLVERVLGEQLRLIRYAQEQTPSSTSTTRDFHNAFRDTTVAFERVFVYLDECVRQVSGFSSQLVPPGTQKDDSGVV